MNARLKFLIDCSIKRLTRAHQACPSCGSVKSTTADRKYVVARLERCLECDLLYRTPISSAEEQARYYQDAYKHGFTTDLPDSASLTELKKNRFNGTEKDYTERIQLLKAATGDKRGRLLDFGCSWGYGTWQLQQAGWDTVGFEISKPRCAYARDKVGVNAHDDLDAITGTFDVFFSSHVLEHVPSITSTLAFAFSKLNKGGIFLSFIPNGSEAFREADYESWHQLWGLDHPNFLDDKFFVRQLAGHQSFLASTPVSGDAVKAWAAARQSAKGDLRGSELVVLVKV